MLTIQETVARVVLNELADIVGGLGGSLLFNEEGGCWEIEVCEPTLGIVALYDVDLDCLFDSLDAGIAARLAAEQIGEIAADELLGHRPAALYYWPGTAGDEPAAGGPLGELLCQVADGLLAFAEWLDQPVPVLA